MFASVCLFVCKTCIKIIKLYKKWIQKLPNLDCSFKSVLLLLVVAANYDKNKLLFISWIYELVGSFGWLVCDLENDDACMTFSNRHPCCRSATLAVFRSIAKWWCLQQKSSNKRQEKTSLLDIALFWSEDIVNFLLGRGP